MEMIPWLLVVVLGLLAAYLGLRGRGDPYPEALDRLLRELREGKDVEPSAPDDPEPVRELRRALFEGWRPRPSEDEDPERRALSGLVRYVGEAVVAPLRKAQEERRYRDGVEDALDALADLAFFARDGRSEEARIENVSTVIQAVTREYALETGIPVKFRGPDGSVPVRVPPERFKDAVFLLLSNAGRFGDGKTVEVVAETEGDLVHIRILDRGPGFSPEALERAFDPFWTTDPDALGLGLTYARRILEPQGARLRVGNREDGGGETVVTLSRAG